MPAPSAVGGSILELIGTTPLVRLSRIAERDAASVVAKLEHFNPSGSHKDRIAARMLDGAEVAGRLRSGDTIVEASCGSFAVALALACRVRGYPLVAVLPDSVAGELKDLLTAYGAALELTPAAQGIEGALAKAAQMEGAAGFVRLNQYESVDNWQAHERGEGAELVAQARQYGAPLDAVVMTIGTGGTLRGIAEAVKGHVPASLLVGIRIQEEGAARFALRRSASPGLFSAGRELEISARAAWRMKDRLAREEGLLVGVTSGANVEGALRIARELGPGKFVYALCCDGGERYFTLEGNLG